MEQLDRLDMLRERVQENRRRVGGRLSTLNPSQRRVVEMIARWQREGPLPFVREVLKVTPTAQQEKALREIGRPGAKVSIRSGHGTGKTSLLAWVVLWGLISFPEVKIPCGANRMEQLSNVLWPEVRKWMSRLPPELEKELVYQAQKIYRVDNPEGAFAVARTCRPQNTEALQGFHSETLIYLIDEASGIDDRIFQAAEGSLTGIRTRIVLAGNPTRTQGVFYRSHTSEAQFWTTLWFNSEESPLVSRQWVEDMARKYGRHSNIYSVRVLGEFPSQEENQFIPLELLYSAAARQGVEAEGPVIWGVDPGGTGPSETALAIRQGRVIHQVMAVRNYNTMQIVQWIMSQAEQVKWKPDYICIDSNGLGVGILDRLQELRYPVVGVNITESAAMSNKYRRLRDELWGRFKDWLETREVSIPQDDELISQAAMLHFDLDMKGCIQIESKKSTAMRTSGSPDRADAVCLTFYLMPAAGQSLIYQDSYLYEYDLFKY